MDMNLHADPRTITDHRDHAETLGRAETEIRSIVRRPAVAAVTCGSGWYHDTAIAQAHQASVEARCNPYR